MSAILNLADHQWDISERITVQGSVHMINSMISVCSELLSLIVIHVKIITSHTQYLYSYYIYLYTYCFLGHDIPLYTRCWCFQPKPVSKHTCIIAAFSSNSVNLWISRAAVSHGARFQHPRTVIPGCDSSMQTHVLQIVRRFFVTVLEGKSGMCNICKIEWLFSVVGNLKLINTN